MANSTIKPKRKRTKLWGRFDVVALLTILVISVSIALVLSNGAQARLRVVNFSWERKTVGIEDRQFRLTFNHPVVRSSLENVQIEPPLSGKISWSGRDLTYTLTEPPIYGVTYQIAVRAQELRDQARPMESFESQFNTRDRRFAYIGVDAEAQGRLILYNLTQQQQNYLTPVDLVVTNFAVYPDGSKMLFSAYERSQSQGFTRQQLYTVTTGLNFSEAEPQPLGRINRLLDAQDYQNLKFELADNGKTIVVGRINRQNPAESGLWVIPETGEPRPLGIPGDDFVVAPNGQSVAVAQSRGITMVPLTTEAGSPEFIPGYDRILGFSPDGAQKLLEKYNEDYTRSLVVIQNGTAKELSRTISPTIGCRFRARSPDLYCLKTDLIEQNGQYQEEPFLSVINLETTKEVPLLALPNYSDVQMSVSPDGIVLLFDQVLTMAPSPNSQPITEDGQAIAAGLLWLLPLPKLQPGNDSVEVVPQELLPGFHPLWLP